MLRAIDLSRAGMLRQQQAMDATAHNIANARTPGFKLERAALETGDVPSPDPAQSTGTDTPALTAQLRINRLFTQGPIRDTGVRTDLAIDGDGFFAVQQRDGSAGYTRNGSLQVDSEGRITDGNGHLVQPLITIPAGATEMDIENNGFITVLEGGNRRQIGQIQVARFTNPNGLVAGADGVYTATAASGPAQAGAPGENGAGRLRTGALEDSNADITEQMAAMMAAQRAYQLSTTAFKTSDEMLRIAGQLQGGG